MIDEINHRATLGMNKPTEEMSILEVGAYEGDATKIFCEYFNDVIVVDPWESGRGDITDKVDMSEIKKRFWLRFGMNNCFYNSGELGFISARCDNLKVFSCSFAAVHFNTVLVLKESDIEKCKPYDMIYIDALHTYEAVKNDIEMAMDLIKVGGILSGHDYREDMFPGVVQAVDEIGGPDCVFSDSSWIKAV